jgi:hypothetical protein
MHPRQRRTRLGRSLAIALAALATLAVSTGVLYACGPFFPDWILGDWASLLSGPNAIFNREIERLVPSGRQDIPVLPRGREDGDTGVDTGEIEAEELDEALAKLGMPEERRSALLGQVAAFRQALDRAGQAAEWAAGEEDTPGNAAGRPAVPDLAGIAVPAGLPAEFARYLEGALAFRRGDARGAQAAWESLLALPAAERPYRSTWAAYMLGRLADPDGGEADDGAATAWYRRTRELAGQGFADGLSLAGASLGWEARFELLHGRPAPALRLYAEQHRQGDPGALLSLRLACRRIFADGLPLAGLAADPVARPIVTAFLASSWDGQQAGKPRLQGWLTAVEGAGVREAAEAAELARVAYLGGDYASAERWLARAPKGAPIARWIEARLRLRAGDIAQAAVLLGDLSRTFPSPQIDEADADWLYAVTEPPIATRARAAGEAGALLLAENRYGEALERFLAGGYWLDAAYVAERGMSLSELEAWVAAEAPARDVGEKSGEAVGPALEPGLGLADVERMKADLRALLGRRLVRAGRFTAALPYLPAELREDAATLAAASGRSARPEALFAAACVTRHDGLEIAGTELEPDWAVFDGDYEAPIDLTRHRLPPRTAEEIRRVARSQVNPWKRFHYRYRAADLARKAAARLPAGSERRAAWLATAGSWIKYRDPGAALPIYRELVRCCSATPIGREARRIHWIPDADACGG